MHDDFDAVIASYHRCEDSGGLFDTFYELLFAKSPEIPSRFADTDMEKQKQVVMASLLWLLRFSKGDPVAEAEIEKLAESHDRNHHDIPPEMYALWVDALCEAAARHDELFTPEIESQWRRVVQAGIERMKVRY